MKNSGRVALAVAGLTLFIAMYEIAPAANRISDVRGTKHNLSAAADLSNTPSGGKVPVRNIKATSETQVCVFCHTPHQAENIPGAPLWNRKLSGTTYTSTTLYSSSSIEANAAELAAAPGGTSKLCLSCHDGTMAIGSVNVLNGQSNPTIAMNIASPAKMPSGSGAATGFTRNLDTTLTNDHPISFTYDGTLATADGELRTPDGSLVGNRVAGSATKPKLPLENNQMQCATCHDPHIRDTDITQNAKFLRMNRLQTAQPTGGSFDQANDIICLACHDKAGQAWAGSAHANSGVATQLYKAAAATQREFPTDTPVWKAACLNCHDTHTVQGARRLLREGTDSTAIPKSGGNSAIEQTCYQCHTTATDSAVVFTANTATAVPDIKTDFGLARHMPITTAEQNGGTTEAHDIGTGSGTKRGKDFVESTTLMGNGTRHVECTDCHNPHRVARTRLFNDDNTVVAAAGTHNHAAGHTNLASGVLRGITGVEPVYGGKAFMTNPTSYDIKRGDGGTGASNAVGSAWVTREYQICLKCHSDNAYGTSPPALGSTGGNTPTTTNGLLNYTNQAMEFQSPTTHQGEVTTTDSGASSAFQTNNHRSWHPVMAKTGRTPSIRNAAASNWLAPWNGAADVGNQTMYCSDCHGSNTATDTVVPANGENGSPWGPHGSGNNFLLKGTWSSTTGNGDSGTGLCFKCHSYSKYATRGEGSSGFGGSKDPNLHSYHADKIGRMRCSWCHIAVPHGWKNKAFLVNLNDVGPEVGLAAGTQVRNSTTAAYNRPPYYMNAMLKVINFKSSGSWSEGDCGSKGSPGNGDTGRNWMRDSNENCKSPP